jgi:AcrR family transcriptional regulator
MTPPKSKFTKEKILDTAFVILKKKGWSHVSARTIAKELNASTMPIYSSVESMKELEKELWTRTFESLQKYQLEKYTDNPFLNSAIGYIFFARDLPNLFKFLFFDHPEKISAGELHKLRNRLPQELRDLSIDFFRKISPQKLDKATLQSWIFTHGLAVLIHSGALTKLSSENIVSMLEEAGGAFFAWDKDKHKEHSKKYSYETKKNNHHFCSMGRTLHNYGHPLDNLDVFHAFNVRGRHQRVSRRNG